MQVEQVSSTVRLTLTERELALLRHALERASFIDTPASEQGEIATFCARALEALPKAK